MALAQRVSAYAVDNDMTTPSGAESSLRTGVLALAYAGAVGVATGMDHPAAWPVAWVVMAAVLFSAHAAMHEAIHSHLFQSKRANRVAGVAWGAVVLANFSAYKAFHLQHHAYTRMEGDTEPHEEFRGAGQYLFYAPMAGALFWVQLLAVSVNALRGRSPSYARTPRQRRDIRSNAWFTTALTVALAGVAIQWPMAVARLWAVPFAMATLAVSFTAIAEHYGCDDTSDSLHSTRTTLSNPVLRFVFWNNNFHAAHHTWPAVPYNKVPRLHERVAPRTRHTARSYTAFHVGLFRELLHKSRSR